VLFALIGAVWSNLRSEITELKSRATQSEREANQLRTDHARSEERDKAFEAGITRLTRAIDDFDTRIGAQIENLSRVVQTMQSRYTPPGGYKYIPNKKEGE
jgi:predicted  nucleic acid-binding Zn-ribbon protein